MITANRTINKVIHWHKCTYCKKLIGCLCNLGKDYPENICDSCYQLVVQTNN